MKRKFTKTLVALGFGLVGILPAFANQTDLTMQADINEMVGIQLETVDTAGKIVSKDDLDPQPGSPAGANEVLNFGVVTPFGILGTYAGGTNGTGGTLESKVIDSTGKLYDVNAAVLPGPTNDGAIYVLQNELLIRTFRTGAISVCDVDLDNVGAFPAIIEKEATNTFAAGTSYTNFLPNTGALRTDFVTANPNGTAVPIDVGIKVPFTLTVTGVQTTKITFTAT